MNPTALLEAVAEAYRNLSSLTVEILSVRESRDDASVNRNEQRGQAFFAAPDRVRIEEGGRRGRVTVTNGVDVHHYFGHDKRYSKSPLLEVGPFPGKFQPAFPIFGTVFLFNRIAERVGEARILREEPIADHVCHVVSVTYEPSSRPGLTVSTSPVVFWVDARTHLLSRLEGETTFRIPEDDEAHTSKQILAFTNVVINEPVSPEIFDYIPPADAIDISDPLGRGGGSSARYGGDRGKRYHSSSEWAGDTLIERTTLKVGDLTVTFERRLSFSEDCKELQISERIVSPAGQTGRDVSLSMV